MPGGVPVAQQKMGAAADHQGSKSTDLGLGGYPLISLMEAREKAQVNRKLARAGTDPPRGAEQLSHLC